MKLISFNKKISWSKTLVKAHFHLKKKELNFCQVA